MARSKLLTEELSPLTKAMLGQMESKPTPEPKKRGTMSVKFVDPIEEEKDAGPASLYKSITNLLDGGDKKSIERLAFETDPTLKNRYSTLYVAKQRLIPDTILKRISIQDDLVAAITNTRSGHVGSFGRPRPDRFSVGFVVDARPGVLDELNSTQKEELQNRIEAFSKKLATCGETKGWADDDRLTFSQYLVMSTRDAVTVGRVATEIIYVMGGDGKKKAHSFRPIDAGTIYKAAPHRSAAENLRREARALLEDLKNKRLQPERFVNDEYSWIQVIAEVPKQAFTAKECLVHNFYPTTHVELGGYPLTPLDTVISAVTMHINITTHNKLYFQTGRASRNMLVIKSEEADEGVVARIKQQFNASINSVNNAHRTPVFVIGPEDEIVVENLDGTGRDMEFQYLSDQNSRVILAAYQMSPDELPGYQHLSRGSNSQALSEGNNEFKLTAARDVGIKPLLKQWEDFLNDRIMPAMDENLAPLVQIQLLGLDAETAEKESIRLQQDAPLHMTYDEVLDKVEKDPVGKQWGGEFPLNPQYQAILDNHSGLTVGELAAHFLGRPDLKDRVDLQYVNSPMWFQNQNILLQKQQMEDAKQQQQAQAQAQQQQQQGQQPQQGQEQQPQDSDLTRSLDQAIGLLAKSERQLPVSKRKLLAQHRMTVEHFMSHWDDDLKEASEKVVAIAKKKVPKKES